MMDSTETAGMDVKLREQLLARAAAYGELTGKKISGVGRAARADPNFFTRLQDPANSFTARTFDEVMRWFDEHWPVSEAAQ